MPFAQPDCDAVATDPIATVVNGGVDSVAVMPVSRSWLTLMNAGPPIAARLNLLVSGSIHRMSVVTADSECERSPVVAVAVRGLSLNNGFGICAVIVGCSLLLKCE